MPDEQPLGLRERKKLDTRKALSDAALHLMFERGLENVVREDIAARAGVSVRTFNNYFTGKYDALVYRHLARLGSAVEILRSRPANEPLWESLTVALLEPFETELAESARYMPTPAELAEVRKLMAAPETRALLAKGAEDNLVAAIAERTGTDPDVDIYPRLVAGAAGAALQAAFEVYARTAPPEPVTHLVRQALAALAAGLPQPPA
ncbi:TetR/AcrR family transcriptional regulator [Nocardia niigatensis]|uniref:TetR/AcrR family transcriptional regulator n=1 Tax=Nocardia niigatensis TaxID=209249 RepID=UPI0002DC1D27|nr:TetR/AcrR family transcriptional regulator [Nocardia niigatensis]